MDSQEIIKKLLEEGDEIDYNNSSTKGQWGYPESFNPNYLSWVSRVEETLDSMFGRTSVVFKMFKKSKGFLILENDSDKFNKSKGYVMGALTTARDMADKPVLTKGEAISSIDNNKVFIVHGHDEKLKNELELFLKKINLEPIILHKQTNEGKTIIEKFEKYGGEVGYAFILLTPDDIAYSVEDSKKDEIPTNHRARQNVIFEFGYFVGKLGRTKVCCIYKSDLELPTDISGMIYNKLNNNIEEMGIKIIEELRAAGYQIAF